MDRKIMRVELFIMVSRTFRLNAVSLSIISNPYPITARPIIIRARGPDIPLMPETSPSRKNRIRPGSRKITASMTIRNPNGTRNLRRLSGSEIIFLKM